MVAYHQTSRIHDLCASMSPWRANQAPRLQRSRGGCQSCHKEYSSTVTVHIQTYCGQLSNTGLYNTPLLLRWPALSDTSFGEGCTGMIQLIALFPHLHQAEPAACNLPTFNIAYIFPKFVLCKRSSPRLPSPNTWKVFTAINQTHLCVLFWNVLLTLCEQSAYFYSNILFHGNIYNMLLVNTSRGINAVKVGKCTALSFTVSSYPPHLDTGLKVWKSRAANIKLKSINSIQSLFSNCAIVLYDKINITFSFFLKYLFYIVVW